MLETLIFLACLMCAAVYIEGGMRFAMRVEGPVWYKMLITFFWAPMIVVHWLRK